MKISTQKAVAISKKEFDGKLPSVGESFLLKTGAKLYKLGKGVYMVLGYSYDKKDERYYA